MRTTVRSGSATALRIVGGIFLAVALASLVVAAVLTVSSGPAGAMLVIGGLGLLFLVLGTVFLVLGLRTRAVVGPEGLSWTPVLGSRKSVAWSEVQQVLVPGDGDPGRCLQLLMRDGSVRPVPAIAKMRNSETNRQMATRGYLRAAETVRTAHHAWWASRS